MAAIYPWNWFICSRLKMAFMLEFTRVVSIYINTRLVTETVILILYNFSAFNNSLLFNILVQNTLFKYVSVLKWSNLQNAHYIWKLFLYHHLFTNCYSHIFQAFSLWNILYITSQVDNWTRNNQNKRLRQ